MFRLLKLLLSAVLFCPLLHSFQLNRVILSTNNNPAYIEFWPIVAPLWRSMGIEPTLALIATEDCPIDTSIGEVIRFDPIPGIPESLQAQVIRLFLPSYFPDDVCLISDIDMLPISRSYFIDFAAHCPEDAFLVYRDRVVEYNNTRYPMCYVAAKGSVFNSVFEIHRYPSIRDLIIDWAAKNIGWNTDEIMLYSSLMEWERKGGHIMRLGHGVGPRLDRGNWPNDFRYIDYSKYIDCHCPRPYSQHRESIDFVVEEIWKLYGPQMSLSPMPSPMNEWQHLDKRIGLVFPWLTKPFLDVLITWNIKDWDIFEWGTGYSTVWFATKCKTIVSVDCAPNWSYATQTQLNQLNLKNVVLKTRSPGHPMVIGDGGEDSPYVLSIDEDDKLYDCIIIDGSFHRNSCAKHILKHIKNNGIIILDNANQASVGLDSSSTFELLKDYEHFSYLQPGHPDWRTDFWIITK